MAPRAHLFRRGHRQEEVAVLEKRDIDEREDAAGNVGEDNEVLEGGDAALFPLNDIALILGVRHHEGKELDRESCTKVPSKRCSRARVTTVVSRIRTKYSKTVVK